jgi:hypothetical protein
VFRRFAQPVGFRVPELVLWARRRLPGSRSHVDAQGVHVVSCGCCLVHGGPEKRLFVADPLSGAKNDGSERPCPGEPETTNCLGSGRVATLALSSCESLEKGTCCIRNIPPVTSKGRRNFRARAHFRARFYCNTGPPSAFRRERCEVQLVNRC